MHTLILLLLILVWMKMGPLLIASGILFAAVVVTKILDKRKLYGAELIIGVFLVGFAVLFVHAQVYLIVNQTTLPIGANPLTFRVIDKEYSSDGSHVYCDLGQSLLPGVDPKTFTHVAYEKIDQSNYGKDSKHVYYRCQEAGGADPATFVWLGNGYSKDLSHVYYYSNNVVAYTTIGIGPIPNADAATFTLILPPRPCLHYYSCEAKDKNYYYFLGQILK